MLEKGMLLFDPRARKLYTATGRRTLITRHRTSTETATLTKSGVPEGWLVIDTQLLADLIDSVVGLESAISARAVEHG